MKKKPNWASMSKLGNHDVLGMYRQEQQEYVPQTNGVDGVMTWRGVRIVVDEDVPRDSLGYVVSEEEEEHGDYSGSVTDGVRSGVDE